jgi:hypothetical protein
VSPVDVLLVSVSPPDEGSSVDIRFDGSELVLVVSGSRGTEVSLPGNVEELTDVLVAADVSIVVVGLALSVVVAEVPVSVLSVPDVLGASSV